MAVQKSKFLVYLDPKDHEKLKVVAFFQSQSVNEVVCNLIHDYVTHRIPKIEDKIAKYNEIKANSEKEVK